MGEMLSGETAFDFKCPFCGLYVTLCSLKHPDTGKMEDSVLHAVPMCKQFDKMPAKKYVKILLKAKG